MTCLSVTQVFGLNYVCMPGMQTLSAETQHAYAISFSTDYAPEPFQSLQAVITCVPALRHLSPNP